MIRSKSAPANEYPSQEASDGQSADLSSFLSLAKETGRILNNFTPPDGFRPEEPVPVSPLPPELARELGSSSLNDFYALALEGEETAFPVRGQRAPVFFPRGPESIRPALVAIDAEAGRLSREVEELDSKWPVQRPGFEAAVRSLDNRLVALAESRTDLVRAARLWPRMKGEAAVWPKEARHLRQRAQRLQEVVNNLLKAVQGGGGESESRSQTDLGRRSLTRAALDLKAEVGSAQTFLTAETGWINALEALSGEIDDLLTVVVDSSQIDRDWNVDSRRLSARLTELEREDRRLKDESARTSDSLRRALAALAETESRLAGPSGTETLSRLENAGRGAQALWRSTVERRREMARIYFDLPSRLGHPIYLEKIFIATAQALGRTQALLEDLRHRLALAGSRMSTTIRLRAEGEKLVGRLGQIRARTPKLQLTRRRLASLAGVMDQRLALKAAKGELEEALTLSRTENSRMLKELRAAALEKERLGEQLTNASQGLGEMGQAKARLLKVYESKTTLLKEVELARQELMGENETLKAERAEIRAKRSRLAELYAQERRDIKRLTAELRESQGELAKSRGFSAERRNLEARLDETRLEREALDKRRREVEDRLQQQSDQLAAWSAQVESLSAELNRHREELAEASRARLALGEKVTVLRRSLALLAQAHDSLLKTLKRRERGQSRAEAERDGLSGRLTRQNRNLLRLVAVRQELRAELGHARLKLSDLEQERDAIFQQLEEAKAHLEAAGREKSELADENKALAAKTTEQTAAMEALQTRLTALAGEKTVLTSQLAALTSENSRLADGSADRDLEKTCLSTRLAGLQDETNRLNFRFKELVAENDSLTGRLAEMEGRPGADYLAPFIKILSEALWRSEAQLKRARSASGRLVQQFKLEAEVREANLRLQAAGHEIEYVTKAREESGQLNASIAAQSREFQEKVARLDERRRKLRQALATLNQRYRHRLEDSRLTEESLRGLLDRQGREIEAQKASLAKLEPLVAHFFEAAQVEEEPVGVSLVDPILVNYLKSESRALQTELDREAPAEGQAPETIELNGLKARLEELQPLVAFLARSFVNSVAQLAQARQERSTLAEELAQAGSTRKVLENSLASREAELTDVRSKAFDLARERDQLQDTLAERGMDITALKSELAQADRDLTDNDGRLEAAWAAMNYLGTRAGDTLTSLKTKLDSQAHQVDDLSLELKKREETIKALENRQGRLALLYWTLVSQAQIIPVLQPDEEPPVLPDLDISVDLALEERPALSEGNKDDARNSGGFSLGKGLLESVRKVARRSLFTLIMAGGLVMASSYSALAAPPESPFPAPASIGEAPAHLLFRLHSTFIGRTVGLELLEPEARLAGRPAMENRLAEMVTDLAADQGLTNAEFLRLLRAARTPESTVHLGDFTGLSGGLALLEAHLPKMIRQLSTWPADVLGSDKLIALMKSAADFKPAEGGFWERLFFDFLAGGSPGQAIDQLLADLEQKKILRNLIPPEYAGRLAPFAQLENLGPERFITFMADYIKTSWPNLSGRGRQQAARRLAGDIYFAARLFKLPVALLAALTQEEAEADQIDFSRRGGTSALHNRAADLADLTRSFTLTWQAGRPPLCDLDEALASSEEASFIEGVYRKKMALVLAFNKARNSGKTLFDALGGGLRL